MTNKFISLIKECNNIVFFGGAGVSTESGVKDYRSPDGIYNTVKEFGISPEKILSRSFFEKDPATFYEFYRKYFMISVEPNDGHKALAELEKMGKLKAVITQNIDFLHQRAGSEKVIELHGRANEFYCNKCNGFHDNYSAIESINNGKVPLCDKCGAVVKPRVVLYEERLFDGVCESAIDAISEADMLIVGGTSLTVYPAASFIGYFKGKHLVIINKQATDYDSNAALVIREPIGRFLKETMKGLSVTTDI